MPSLTLPARRGVRFAPPVRIFLVRVPFTRRTMPLAIRTETLAPAPNGRPNSRRTVGVGESVVFRTDPERAAHWTHAGVRTRTAIRQQAYSFNTPGDFVVRAEVGGERAEGTITVVAPAVRYEKVSEPSVPSGVRTWLVANNRPIPADLDRCVGVAMVLRLVLDPLSVSFGSVEVRERDCPAEATTGVYARPGVAPPHSATPGFTAVGPGNALTFNDIAAGLWVPSHFSWPIPASSYTWRIPLVYRVSGTTAEVPFPATVVQKVQFTPDPAAGTTPRGTFSVTKGGQTATARV
jgi:hypothetical protein